MQTVNVSLKIGTMRKEQDFVIYPVKRDDKTFLIQSETRIGKVGIKDKRIYLSKSRSNGSYGVDLSKLRGAKLIELDDNSFNQLMLGFDKMARLTEKSGSSKNDRTITLVGRQ